MEDKDKIIELLQAENAALRARIEVLEQLLSKFLSPKTSKNSHLSPSSDLARKNQSLRPKSDNPVGGQKGHDGHTLKMSEKPDVIEILSSDFCSKCGLSLVGGEFELAARRQVKDIPPIVATITEYQSMKTICACGHCQVADFPQGVDNHIQYGPNIQSLVVYQSYYQYIPFARLQDFFAKVCQVSISKGTLENIIRRTANKAEGTYEHLRQVIAVSFFVGSDETGFKLNATKGWFWVWQNAIITFIVASSSRSKKVIEEYFPEGLPNSIICSDRLAAQLSTIRKGTQLCLAHLLRDLNYLIEAEKTDWAIQFKALLQAAIKLKQEQSAYASSDIQCLEIERRLEQLLSNEQVLVLLANSLKYKQTITFYRAMSKLRHGLFTFLYHEQVPFDNNGSERAIRMIKVKTKISGQFKSLQQEFAVIRSVIDTTIKNGQSVMNAIHAILRCQA
jgi:transposase